MNPLLKMKIQVLDFKKNILKQRGSKIFKLLWNKKWFISSLVNYQVLTSTEYEVNTRSSEINACNSVQKKNTMQTGISTQNRMGLSYLLNFLDHFKTPFFICFFPIIVLNPLWFISSLNIFIKISPSANLISKKEAKYVCKSRITYEDLERNWIHRKLGRNVLTCPGKKTKQNINFLFIELKSIFHWQN